MDRNEAIIRIRKALKARSGKTWSVRGGTGTSWGWIEIDAPPSRKAGKFERMSEADQMELSRLLDKSVHSQGESIPASREYREEFVARAEGRKPTVYGSQYWD